MAGPPPRGTSLLDLLEPGWRRHLSAGGLAGTLEVGTTVRDTVARALGDQSRGRSPMEVAHRWPACLVVGLAQVAAGSYRDGRFWPGWHRAAGLRATRRSADHWGQAFVEALTVLGITTPGTGREEAVFVHAAVPDACLPEFLRLVAAGCDVGGDGADADMPGTDPAVAALLRSGGPAVTSFVERCRSTLRLMTAPDRPAEGDQPTGDQPVPQRILDAAEVVAAELASGPPAGVLRLEPFGRGVLVADGGDQTWRSAVPSEVTNPLLVFDEGGGHVGRVLPAEPVWVVHPADLALCSDVPPRVMVTSRLPLTWRGWRMAQLDLRGVSWLELEIPDKAARRRHRVRGRLKPYLATGPQVPGVTTATAAPVHARLPTVLLPAGAGRWRIEARRAGGASSRGGPGGSSPRAGTVLAAITTTAADWRPDQLWRQVSRPVLGAVVVTVTPADRSAGAGLRRTVTVAEGLSVAYSPVPRLTSEHGLEPAEAVLTAPAGMTVSPLAALIPAGSATTGMTCIAGPVVVPLRVRPPHLRMRIEPEPGSGGKPTAWHHLGPLAIDGSELRRGGALRLDLPGLGWDPPLEVIAREQVVQVLQPTRQGRYPLRRMLDTVNSHREVSLRVTAAGRTAIVAHVRETADRADPWLPAGTAPSAR